LVFQNEKETCGEKKATIYRAVRVFQGHSNDGNLSATYALGRLFDVCEDGAILSTECCG
jgi:hypothetical protein